MAQKSNKNSNLFKKYRELVTAKFLILIVVVIIISIILWKPLTHSLSNVTRFKQFILGFGSFAPLVFIGISALQVIIAPIPGQAVGILGGYTFGLTYGTMYGIIGLTIGSLAAFWLAKRYGRPFAEAIISKETMRKFDKISGKAGLFTIFMLYLIPIFPDDAMCFVFGMTKTKIRTLMVVTMLARIPGILALALIGNGMSHPISRITWTLLVSVTMIAVGLYLNKEALEKKAMEMLNSIRVKKEKIRR